VKLSALQTVLRDFVSMALGVFVIAHQELHGRTDWTAWSVGLALTLGPAAPAVVNIFRGKPGPSDTTGSSSESAERSRLG
jgi:hypothetical protein